MAARLHAILAASALQMHPNGTYDLLGIVNGFHVARFPLSPTLTIVSMWTGVPNTPSEQRWRYTQPDGKQFDWMTVSLPPCPDPRYIVTNHWRLSVELSCPGLLRVETETAGGNGCLEIPVLQREVF